MRLLVCGSRTWTDRQAIRRAFAAVEAEHVVLIHGAAPGADSLADSEARLTFGWDVISYPADWKWYGRAAGPIRNARMLREGRPEFVFAFRCRGKSRGTDDMIARARDAGLAVQVVTEDS